jgi:hypothetical protein
LRIAELSPHQEVLMKKIIPDSEIRIPKLNKGGEMNGNNT